MHLKQRKSLDVQVNFAVDIERCVDLAARDVVVVIVDLALADVDTQTQ